MKTDTRCVLCFVAVYLKHFCWVLKH